MSKLGVVAYWSVHPWVTAHKSGPKRWISLYAYTLRAFGGTDLILIGRSLPKYVSHDFNFRGYPSLELALKDYSNAKLVALMSDTSANVKIVNLEDYHHPKGNVLYIAGSDYGDVEVGKLLKSGRCDFVRIETPVDFALWAHVAVAIALYDRNQKRWR